MSEEGVIVNHRVTWIEADCSFDASSGETVLDAALRAGVRLPSECAFGGCGTCRVKLLDGRVQYDEPPLALSPDEAAAGYALMCQAKALADLRISTDRPLPAPVAPERRRATVVASGPLCNDVQRLVLSLDRETPFAFRPGQYLNVLLGDAGARSFSMASLPGETSVELHIRRIDGGYFTGALLDALRPGDALDVELPLGGFGYHEEDYRPIVMAATGTGIAPLRSMLAALLPSGDCPPVALYWGGRTRADLYLHDEFVAWSAQYADFSYTPVLSRAGDEWDGARGYVQHAVAADHDDLSEHALYLCGSPDMIADAKRVFARHGASVRYLYADGFTFQRATPLEAGR